MKWAKVLPSSNFDLKKVWWVASLFLFSEYFMSITVLRLAALCAYW